MRLHPVGMLVLGLLVLGRSPLHAVEPLSEQDLAKKIDQRLAARWKVESVKPAPLADDAEYLRRVYLDLVGRIPSLAEARAFLDDRKPDKRVWLVRSLLEKGAHVQHFVSVWRDLLIPESNNGAVQGQLNGFNDWLRKQFSENVPYDRMIAELLTVPFGSERLRRRGMTRSEPADAATPTPRAFYEAKDAKPEILAASTARLFLGVRIECAQCHNHPFGSWTRQHFWGYAAFFAGLQRDGADNGGVIREVFDRRDIKIPGSLTSVEARFLDETEPRWKYNVGARTTLAEWLTAADNPYFARATVNRLWAHSFGVGLVEPVDDFRSDNPPSHPELLEELARQFVAHRFDLQYLMRSIVASRAYQLTSAATAASSMDSRLFARMTVKGLTPEQLFDSLAVATGYRPPPTPPPMPMTPAPPDARAEFLARFAGGQPGTETQRSIPQALMLMNGRFIAAATRLKDGDFLTSVANDHSLDTAGKIETLFLATLSRKPTPTEARRLVQYVDGGGARKDARLALGDVLWALLNSAEFNLNH
ncbi:MAG TPA: DUF1549 and DUF1553 domain-containing protein [Gemmataceae bacterium]|nr:DUF1549 and DUF1553 domain-containing protein [Gemmataceae bacterium]